MQEGTFDAVLQLLELSPKKNKNGGYRYLAKFNDNTTKTLWDADEAREMGALVNGQPFPVRYKVEQSGKYTNITIEAWVPPGEELPFDPEATAAPEVAVVAKQAEASGLATSQGGGQWDENTTARVSKLAVIGHATQLVASLYQGAGPEALEQALGDVKKVGGELYKLARKHEQQNAQNQATTTTQPAPEAEKIQPAATTAEEVAQSVPGVVVGTSALPETEAVTAPSAGMSDSDWD